jgi:hypothetical protein
MSVRGQLKSIRILLEEAKSTEQSGRLRTADEVGLAERIQEIHDRIEHMPQMSAVRPATIALHNLVVSLRRPETSQALDQEIDVAIESIEELLADPMFGISADELRNQAIEALMARGIDGCAACKDPTVSVELVYALVKPYPSEPTLLPSQLPCAMVMCRRCGLVRLHDLAVLGVI